MDKKCISTYVLFISLALPVLVIGQEDDFLCYSCTYTGNPSRENYECVTTPQNYTGGPNQVSCPTEQTCFIYRKVSLFSGDVDLLRRGCGYQTDGCDSDSYMQECYETCTTNLCNSRNVDVVKTTVTGYSSTTTRDPNQPLECWNCEYESAVDGGNDVCVTDPENVVPEEGKPITVRCSAGDVCVIIRTHDSETQRVQLFSRTCGDNDESYCVDNGIGSEVCLTTCTTDLCNDGDGLVGIANHHFSNTVTIVSCLLLTRLLSPEY